MPLKFLLSALLLITVAGHYASLRVTATRHAELQLRYSSLQRSISALTEELEKAHAANITARQELQKLKDSDEDTKTFLATPIPNDLRRLLLSTESAPDS